MNSKLADILNRPLNIGNTTIEKRLVLAPMAFLGNVAFRQLVQTYGGYGLLFTEMCSAKRIPNENRHRSTYFRWRDAELSHLVCQIFGDDPMSMAKAVSIPLFVKYRIGWKDNPRAAIDMARRFEDAGADALTFHPRIAPDRRLRPAKWEYIGMVKQAVNIPVFGNGDVFDQTDCLKMVTTTGCDGVAIGRMAIARPWLFAEWTDGYQGGTEIYLESALRLAGLLEAHFDHPKALRRFKKFGFYFSANFKFGHTLFSTIQKAETMAEAKEVLHRFFERPLETVSRPNLNFFR
jgi:tRNA-dihydrouridine synthase